jgi:hypothetical protein
MNSWAMVYKQGDAFPFYIAHGFNREIKWLMKSFEWIHPFRSIF